MIGDNPVTDIAGAEKLGMTSILVSPGSEVCLRDLIAPLDQRKP
jgi:ribonucleotide monophosphatase NagD (HAD superfamily)